MSSADTNELQVHALAVDRRGTLYAGTSPRGLVYRIAPEVGSHEVFFDPDDRYIWALAVDSLNNVIVATGDEAKIYRVTSSGESEVLFTSQETHIVSLAIGNNDTIYAGTESNGLVLEIDGDGATSVLFDTPFQEVPAITTDTRGNVFVAAIQSGTRGDSSPVTVSDSPGSIDHYAYRGHRDGDRDRHCDAGPIGIVTADSGELVGTRERLSNYSGRRGRATVDVP